MDRETGNRYQWLMYNFFVLNFILLLKHKVLSLYIELAIVCLKYNLCSRANFPQYQARVQEATEKKTPR